MKLDMHCHTHEGSVDSKVNIYDYIRILQSQGYDGMLVTDHDSYNGYRTFRDTIKENLKDFVVLKGIEYDTLDAGHILIIMPENVKLLILECRGLPIKMLQDIVHKHGGILGPAHPCGERHLSFTRTRAYKKHPELMKGFDFVEGYNSCESPETNNKAQLLAYKYGLPILGGSDSHWAKCIGTAYTIIDQNISTESELIQYLKSKKRTEVGGGYFMGTIKHRIGFFNHFLVEAFWFYNRFESLIHRRRRKKAMKLLK